MSKITKIILLSFIFAVLITFGSYFISNSSTVSFTQPFGECALTIDILLPSQSQNITSHGFPVVYKQDTPHQFANGICGPILVYTHKYNYAYVGLDVLIWWALVFTIFQVFRSKKKERNSNLMQCVAPLY